MGGRGLHREVEGPGSGQSLSKLLVPSPSVWVWWVMLVPYMLACVHSVVRALHGIFSCLCCCSGLRFVVREVPAVRLFRHGMMFPYQGPPQHMGVPGEV